MAYSTCCGAHTNFTELGICPDCLEHCDWEVEEEPTDEQIFNNAKTEGGISYGNSGSTWKGR